MGTEEMIDEKQKNDADDKGCGLRVRNSKLETRNSKLEARNFRVVATLVVLACLLIIAVVFSLSYGTHPGAAFDALFRNDGFGLVLKRIRIPRTILAFLVGGSLGICGVALQAVLRNPLAEPYTLGISGGASLGVTISAVTGLQHYLGIYSNPLLGFGGAMFSVLIVYRLSSRRFFNPNSMVLFGIVVGLVFSSLVFFLFSILDPDRMQITLMWLMGDLSSLDVSLLPAYVPMFLLPAAILMAFGREMDILSLGAEKAHYLGINPQRIYRILFLLTSLLAGLSVSAAGIIGFVGLLVPHILRNIIGPGHSYLLVSSYLAGALFLIVSDLLSRYLLYPVELPAGVITGISGGFILAILLVRKA
jgi:iron complex transport system permease protein